MNKILNEQLANLGYTASSQNHVKCDVSSTDTNIEMGTAPLPFYTVVHVTGADATQFLQNQLSNDIKQLSTEASQLSCYSSAKGMMYGNFRILKTDGGYLLRLSTDTHATLCKRLSMFVLRDDVQFNAESGWMVLGLSGQNSESALSKLGLDLPPQPDAVTLTNSIYVVRGVHRDNAPRFELYAHADQGLKLLETAKANGIALTNSEDYLAQQIRDCEPVVTEPTYEQFVAQMLNLELINGVNFKKGCYPGQEYIARTQYRGQVRSRTFVVSSNEPNSLTAGQDVFAEGTTPSIGTVLNVANTPEGCVGLAVLRLKQSEGSELFIKNEQDAKLCTIEKHEPPYSLSTNE